MDITETQWKNAQDHIKQLIATNKELHRELDEIASHMPECWPGDARAPEFVASLLNGTTDTPGHAPDCDCW